MLILLQQKPFSYFQHFGIFIIVVTNCVTLSCQNKLSGLFSNSLINLKFKQRKSLTVMLFGYLILISWEFMILVLHCLLSFSFDWEDTCISNTQTIQCLTILPNNAKFVKNLYSVCDIFNSHHLCLIVYFNNKENLIMDFMLFIDMKRIAKKMIF